MHQASLNLDEPASSLRAERHQLVKVIFRKGIPFCGSLNLHEQSASGFNQIHIYLGLGILFIVQIQQQARRSPPQRSSLLRSLVEAACAGSLPQPTAAAPGPKPRKHP